MNAINLFVKSYHNSRKQFVRNAKELKLNPVKNYQAYRKTTFIKMQKKTFYACK